MPIIPITMSSFTSDKKITSPQNEKIKGLIALRRKKNRRAQGEFLLEGVQAILSAKEAARPIDEIFYTAASTQQQKFAQLVDEHPQSYLITDQLALKISERDNPLTAFAVLPCWQQPIEKLSLPPAALAIAIDRGRDPGNLGTIIRSLAAAGGQVIILVGESVDAFAPETARATMGALARVDIYYASEADFLAWAKQAKHKNQLTITATLPRGGHSFRTLHYPRPHLLLVGNEQQGLTPALVAVAQQQATIAMASGVESLNLAIASSIMLFEAVK